MWRGVARASLLVGGGFVLHVVVAAVYVAVVYARLPEPSEADTRTAFMAEDGCRHRDHTPLPFESIDPRIVCAVVWAEDWRFFRHDGIDKIALQAAIKRNYRERRWAVGASTVAMQLARNLYFGRTRNPSRKLKELMLAPRLTRTLGRRRVLERYLNSAEFGSCVYGVEAGMQHHFGVSAQAVTLVQASSLAALLPSPSRARWGAKHRRAYRARRTRILHQLAAVAGTQKVARALQGTDVQGGLQPAPQQWLVAGCGTLPPGSVAWP